MMCIAPAAKDAAVDPQLIVAQLRKGCATCQAVTN
jgi:hypothetical protein